MVKRTILTVLILYGTTNMAETVMADLLATEQFGYSTGTTLAGNGAATDLGWASSWTAVSSASNQTITADSLDYPEIAESGNRVTCVSLGRSTRLLDVSGSGSFADAGLVDSGGMIGADNTTVYLSFLQNFTSTPSSSARYAAFELNAGSAADGNRALIIGIDDTWSANYSECYGIGSAINGIHDSFDEAATTGVSLMVVKIAFGAGDVDTVSVYRNPESLADESLCTVDATLSGDFSFDRAQLARFYPTSGGPAHEVDAIRFGTTWGAVVPEPSSVTLSAMVLLMLAGMGMRRMYR